MNPKSVITRRRKLFFISVSIGLGCLAGLLVIEFVLRLSFGSPRLPSAVGLHEHDPVLGYRMKKHYEGKFNSAEFKTAVRTNAEGFRDDEWDGGGDEDDEESTRRIVLALGDSFAFGQGVDHEENFLTLAEQADSPGGGRYDVLNAGVYGWGPAQQITILEELLAKHRADIVLLVFFAGNDFADTDRPRGWAVPYDGVLLPKNRYENRNFGTRVKIFARKHSKTYELFRDAVRSTLFGVRDRYEGFRVIVESCRISPEPTIEKKGQADAVRRWFSEFREVCRRHGARPAIVIIPSLFQCSEREWEKLLTIFEMDAEEFSPEFPSRTAAELAEQLSIPALDLLDAMREDSVEGDELYYPKDNHWNADGHAWAAKHLIGFLREIETSIDADR